MKNKPQIIFIRGGETLKKKEDFYEYLQNKEIDLTNNYKSWRDWLTLELVDSYDFLTPDMPSRQDSDYIAWKIWFERHLEFIDDEHPILIGYSLGGTFLLKYLSENKFSKNIKQLHLISSCVFDNFDEGVTKERLDTFNFNINDIEKVGKWCSNIHLWHSEDDSCVSFKNFKFLKEKLPNVTPHIFKDRGHFFQPEFPELLDEILK